MPALLRRMSPRRLPEQAVRPVRPEVVAVPQIPPAHPTLMAAVVAVDREPQERQPVQAEFLVVVVVARPIPVTPVPAVSAKSPLPIRYPPPEVSPVQQAQVLLRVLVRVFVPVREAQPALPPFLELARKM
jgi:hypothetical protein